MNKTEHTKEPWNVGENDAAGNFIIEDSRSQIVCIVGDEDQDNAANARRIVACVNACEGISTEQLEQTQHARELILGGLVQPITELKAERDQLRSLNGDLLNALYWTLARVDCSYMNGEQLARYMAVKDLLSRHSKGEA